MRSPRIRHDFETPGFWVTWEDDCWIHEVRLVGQGEEAVVAEERHRSRHDGAVPAGGLTSAHRDAVTQGQVWAALDGLQELFDRAHPERGERALFALAGFDNRNLERPRRPRGQPRTPDKLLAAVAVLWEAHQSRERVAAIADQSPSWVKTRVRQARDRGWLDGEIATDAARDLVGDEAGARRYARDWRSRGDGMD